MCGERGGGGECPSSATGSAKQPALPASFITLRGLPQGSLQPGAVCEPGAQDWEPEDRDGVKAETRDRSAQRGGRAPGVGGRGGRGLTRMMRTLYMRVSRSSLSSEL